MTRGGSRCKLWKYLDRFPEVSAGMQLQGADELGAAPLDADGKPASYEVCAANDVAAWGLHQATWTKYIGYGWVTQDRRLTKKGLRTYQQQEQSS